MPDRPNFLIICVDQMQSFCLGCNDHPLVRTPHIDALAASGVNFRRGYCNNPVCMPSRATMITGQMPNAHGLLTNGNSLPEHIPTITQALVDAGYRTHAVGKLHLQPTAAMAYDGESSSWESREGWESRQIEALPAPYYGYQSVDLCDGHVNYAFGDYSRWLDAEHPGMRDRLKAENAYHQHGCAWRIDMPQELHYNHWIADRTIDFLRKHDDDEAPFFLFCSFPDPHFAFAACKPWSELYDPAEVPIPETFADAEDGCGFLRDNRQVASQNVAPDEAELREVIAQTLGMISHVDHNVGRVLNALSAGGLDATTHVAFIADHGEYLGSHHLLRKGAWPHEELVRVPFIWRAPGGAQATVDSPVSLLDLAPTLSDLAGLPAEWHDIRGVGGGTRPGLPGTSLRPALESGRQPIAPVLLEYDEDFHEGGPLTRQRGIIFGDWKLVMYGGYPDGLLVNVVDDPHERRNRWSDPACAELKTELLAFLVERLAYSDRFDTYRMSGA